MLDQAVARLRDLVTPHYQREGCLPEADDSINNASRRVVKAMYEEHGECWLGTINYGDDRGKANKVLQKWDGERTVLNFECAFVIPKYDEELVKLIIERDQAAYEGTKKDAERMDAIFDHFIKLGGHYLHWT